MSNLSIERQLRRFLLTMAGLAFLATIAELTFVEHTETAIQLVPFFLSGVGAITVLIVSLKPLKKAIVLHRIVMSVILLGGFFGIYEHIEHNFAFELEIRPNAVASDVIWESLSGASPLIAPGILTFAAVLALMATWRQGS